MPEARDPYDRSLNPKGTEYVARLIRDVDGGAIQREFAKEAAARKRERRKEATKRRNMLKREADKQKRADRRAKRRARCCKKRETYRRGVVWHEQRAGARGGLRWWITLSCGHVEVRQISHWAPRSDGRPLRCKTCARGATQATADPAATEDLREATKAAV